MMAITKRTISAIENRSSPPLGDGFVVVVVVAFGLVVVVTSMELTVIRLQLDLVSPSEQRAIA